MLKTYTLSGKMQSEK